MHLTPMAKALMSAVESAEGLFYKHVFRKYAEYRKGRMRVLCRPTGPETRRKHLTEQFAWNLIICKERLMKANDYPQKQEDIEDTAKDITYMQNDAELRQSLEKANARFASKRTGSKKSLLQYMERRREIKNETNTNPVPVGAPSSPPAEESEEATSLLKLRLPSKTTMARVHYGSLFRHECLYRTCRATKNFEEVQIRSIFRRRMPAAYKCIVEKRSENQGNY